MERLVHAGAREPASEFFRAVAGASYYIIYLCTKSFEQKSFVKHPHAQAFVCLLLHNTLYHKTLFYDENRIAFFLSIKIKFYSVIGWFYLKNVWENVCDMRGGINLQRIICFKAEN